MTSFFKAKKSLGQHFLMHARIAERIVLAAKLSLDATVRSQLSTLIPDFSITTQFILAQRADR